MAEGKMHWINLYFACRVSGNVQLNEGSTEFAWIDPKEPGKYPVIFGGADALNRYWAKAEG